jgi:hypothetical protein
MRLVRTGLHPHRSGSRFLRGLGWLVVVLGVFASAYGLIVRPWSLHWGASDTERTSVLLGDELMVSAQRQVTRAITIRAAPERIYPWLVQMGAERGGLYSYDWLETNLLRCPIQNANRIVPEWQRPKLGDPIRLCPEGRGPPMVYRVARLEPNRAFVIGVREGSSWGHTWAFVLHPRSDGTTRLVVRSRTALEQPWQTWLEFGEFVMERGMMLGLRERAERQ